MAAQNFKTLIVKMGTRTVISLPFNPDDAWGARQRHHVTGSINGFKVRGPLGSEGTEYFFSLGPTWLRDNGLAAGAEVAVTLSPEGPQPEDAPDIASALASEPQARDFFVALPTFYRNNYVRWIESARRPETRRQRIAEMVELLKAGKRQK